MKCYYHPDREAVALCSECKKPLCKECAINYNGKIYCKDCFEKVQSKGKIFKKENLDKPYSVVIPALIISIGIILAIIALFFFYSQRITPSTGKSYNAVLNSAPYNGEEDVNVKAEVKNVLIKIQKADDSKDLYRVVSNGVKPRVSFTEETRTINIEATNGIRRLRGENSITLYISPKVNAVSFSVKNGVGGVNVSDLDNVSGSISVGVGNVVITDTSFNRIDVKVGVGNVSLDNCKFNGASTVYSGTGNITLQGINETTSLNVKLGTGNFKLRDPKLLRDLVVVQGSGNCNISLVNAPLPLKEDWHISVNKGIGETVIDADSVPIVRDIRALNIDDTYYNSNSEATNEHSVYITVFSTGKVKLIGGER